MGICLHTDDVRCSNCSHVTYRPCAPVGFSDNLKTHDSSAMLRALGRTLQDGPCTVEDCFVCSGSVGGRAEG